MPNMTPATGANALRGGDRVFQRQTLIGNWEEDREEVPAPLKFERSGYKTTKGLADAEATRLPTQRFGQEVTRMKGSKPKNVIQYQEQDPEVYMSVASMSQIDGESFKRAYGSKFPLAPCAKLTKERMSAYRQRWSRDLHRDTRFVTDQLANTRNMPAFHVQGVRSSPNLPLHVDALASELKSTTATKGGLSGLSKLLTVMDEQETGIVNREQFRVALIDMGLKLNDDVFAGMWTYFDPDANGKAQYQTIMELLNGDRDPLAVV
jgi:hypothetical protein